MTGDEEFYAELGELDKRIERFADQPPTVTPGAMAGIKKRADAAAADKAYWKRERQKPKIGKRGVTTDKEAGEGETRSSADVLQIGPEP